MNCRRPRGNGLPLGGTMRSRAVRVRRSALTIALAGLGVVFVAGAPPTMAQGGQGQAKVQQAAAAAEPAWVRTGGPIGGIGYDIRSRPDNADVMLVTDISSGVSISVDGGGTWTASNAGIDIRTGDGYPIFSLTIDPHNNDVMWAGTSNRMGIFKSTDGGRTWGHKDNGVAGDLGVIFRGFTVDPTNSNIVYAAGELQSFAWNNGVPLRGKEYDLTKGMVYKTTDGGDHWTRIWYGDNLARYVWIDPGNTNILYVSTGIFDREAANSDAATDFAGGIGVLKSIDGGQTWRALNQSNGLGNLYVGSLFMHPTNPSVLLAATGCGQYGTGAGVYLTTDGGETWTRILAEGTQPFGVVEISTLSPTVAYAVGGGAVYRSDDGYQTWTRYFSGYNIPGEPSAGTFWGPPGMRAGFPIDFEADRRDPMRVFANMYGGGNFLSTDGGKTWVNASRGYTGAMMRSVAVAPTDPDLVYSVAGSGVFRSTDRGGDWQGINWQPATMSELSTVAVSPSNPREVLLSDAFTGKLMKSVDGAQSWGLVLDYGAGIATIPGPIVNRVQGFRSIAFAPSNGRIVYAGMAIANCETNANCGLPTYEGVHRSTDGGTTWQTTAGQGLGRQSILTLAVHPTNPDIVYAGTGAPGLFKTENGGLNWVPINNGISSLYVWSIAIDPSSPDTVYLGTGGAAVFKSTDGGASWRVSSAGLIPNAEIRAILLDPTNPSILWTAAQGTGVYRSTDAGATWVQMNAGLSTRDSRAMAISDDGGTVYVGTQGEGVFRLDLPVAPRVRSHPSSTTVAVGGQAGFATAASGTPTPTVQWQASADSGATWVDVTGAVTTTYAFLASAADSGSQFRAVFSNSLGTATSNAALLTVAVPPTVTITTPTSAATTTATRPFLLVGGTAVSGDPRAAERLRTGTVTAVTWASDRGRSGTAQGLATWEAEVPLFAGVNVLTVTATDAGGEVGTDTLTVTVPSFVYYLAEGATGSFFDLELALANPNAVAAPVAIQYLKEDGSTVNQSLTLGAQSRQTILVNSLTGLSNTAVSTVVTSSNALPLAVERTMTWDSTGYGSHTEKATSGTNLTWYFAEGSEQSFFDTYLLLANPQAVANRATVQFLVEGGSPVTKVYNLLPTSRTNVFAGDVEEPVGTKPLLNKAFGIVVTFDQPGVAERAMYFGTTPFWDGGHESAGVNAPSTSWFHAEGATGAFFDTFILLSNPNSTPATVTLRFLLDSGATVIRTKTVGANARLTVGVEGEDPLLANAAMATQVTSDIPIVSERAMYWAGYPSWYEAHNAFGVTSTGLKWALGEGRVGGTSGYETYILLANPGTTAATVTVTYLREGGLAPIVRTYAVPATSRFNVYANTVPGLGAGERFGALIESTVPIAVERAMYSNAASQPGVVWAAGTNATGTPIP